jgi:hypothetical protein
MKYAIAGVRIVEIAEPDANGKVLGTVWRVAPAHDAAGPPLVESYVDRTPPTGTPCWRFVGGRVRIGKREE